MSTAITFTTYVLTTEFRPMIIAVASGKGGTGKTTIAVNLALALQREYNVKFFDCDVEAPNAYLFLKPQISHSEPVTTACPTVDGTRCNFCGKCAEVCAFHALVVLKERVLLYPELCHYCGGCKLFCPQNAIGKKERKIGIIESGLAGKIAFFHGRLIPGEPFSLPLIRALKRIVSNDSIVILDAPPGTSCPVVTTIEGSDFCLLVTEPTPFGLHDLSLAVELVQKLEIPAGVVVNRADIGDDKVDAYCAEKGLPVLMRLPYDQQLAINYAQGVSAVDVLPEYQQKFSQLYQDINKLSR